ncbi:MAG: transposase domain-containing protein [Xanthomonadales bacterium]|nr:transposase domain-containing protein [Xanthomonadales bacterium]
MIETAKAHDLEPIGYLTRVMRELPRIDPKRNDIDARHDAPGDSGPCEATIPGYARPVWRSPDTGLSDEKLERWLYQRPAHRQAVPAAKLRGDRVETGAQWGDPTIAVVRVPRTAFRRHRLQRVLRRTGCLPR